MRNLPTYTGATRPSSPSAGDAIYLSDVNRLAVYDGDISEWRTFNSDGLVYNAAAPDELHYTNGIYDSPSASYYLDVSPIMHFDANFMNGVDASGNPGVGDPVTSWSDRSGGITGINLSQATAAKQGLYDLTNGLYGVKQASTGYYDLSSTYPLGSQLTQIIIASDPDNTDRIAGLTPSSETCAATLFNLGGACGTTVRLAGAAGNSLTLGTGPLLHVVTRNGAAHNYWYQGGSVHTSKTTTTFSMNAVRMFSQYSGGGTSALIHEVLVFESELTLAQLNKVKNYVNNKYSITASTFV